MTNIKELKDLAIIIKEFITDLNKTFSDKLIDNQNIDMSIIYKADSELVFSIENTLIEDIENYNIKEFYISILNIKKYIEQVYPKHFLNILYQNEDIFSDENDGVYFLPDVNFNELFFDTTSKNTRDTIWKYLQLIAFNSIQSINNISSFGDTADMFKGIDSDEFKNKLKSSIEDITRLFSDSFDTSENQFNQDISDADNNFKEFDNMFKNMFNNTDSNNEISNNMLPDFNDIHNHLNNLLNGKIGSIAKELAEETAKDFEIDENIKSPSDVFNKLLKDPNRLMSLVSNIGSRLDKKMNDGSVNQSELLEEAHEMFKNMKNIPGMNNMETILKSMNLNNMMPQGAKFNNKAFDAMMDSNIKMAKMRERMNKKFQANKQNTSANNSNNSNISNIDTNTNDINKMNENLMLLLKNIENNNIDTDNLNETTYIKKNNQTGNASNRKKKNKNRKR